MMELRKDNHYLSQAYLKNFVNSDNQINTYNLLVSYEKVKVWKYSSVKGVAYHKNLYTYLTAQGLTDEFEKWFHEDFENPVAPILNKVITDAQLTKEDWAVLIHFTATLDVRTPFRLLQYIEESEQVLPQKMQHMLQELMHEFESLTQEEKRNIVPPPKDELFPFRVFTEIEEDRSSGKISVEMPLNRSQWLGQVRHTLTETYKVLLKHRWTILKPAKGLTWFTTDCPVIRLNYYKKGKYDFKGGWDHPGGEILLPLSPSHLLYTKIGTNRAPQRGKTCDIEFTKLTRKLLAEHAYRFIYSSSEDMEIPKLRPRTVNKEKFDNEKQYWNSWHKRNEESEWEYLNE